MAGKPKKKVTLEPQSVEAAKPFSVSFVLDKEERLVEGKNVLDCLEKFIATNDLLKIFKGKIAITSRHEGLKGSAFLYPMHTKRMFYNKTYREILAKRLTLLLT